MLTVFLWLLKIIADQVIYKSKMQNAIWVLQFHVNAKPAGKLILESKL